MSVGACGKTSLLCAFALGEFPKEYVRSLFLLIETLAKCIIYIQRFKRHHPDVVKSDLFILHHSYVRF